MKTEKCLIFKISLMWRLDFHPAMFDNFKDEKMPVSVARKKCWTENLLAKTTKKVSLNRRKKTLFSFEFNYQY